MQSNPADPGGESGDPLEIIELRTARGIRIDYLPVPDKLRALVTTLFYFASDRADLQDMFPALVGLISFTLKGSSQINFPDGTTDHAALVGLLTPTSAAMGVEAHGPYHSIGAVLSPLGWAALTGLHAGQHSDRMYDAGDYFGPEIVELGERMSASYQAGTATPHELLGDVAQFLIGRVRRVNQRHVEMMRQVGIWMANDLDPPLADLFARCAYSPRQVERLVERYYGCPPKMLVRKYRALRVMALLLAEDTTPEQAAALVDLYYDQSHMIRELRQFAGRTPNQLDLNETPVLAALVDIRNYRQIRPQVAPLPEG